MDSMNYKPLVDKYKPEMKDMDLDALELRPYDIVQLKFDGWWTMVIVKDQKVTVVTSGGDIRHNFSLDAEDAVLLCEWGFGTNWSQDPAYANRFFVFDMVSYMGKDLTPFAYSERYNHIAKWLRNCSNSHPPFYQIESYPVDDWYKLWEHEVLQLGFEGLVFKNTHDSLNSRASLGRLKRTFTADYVIMDKKEGTGRLVGTLGAIVGGQYVNGTLTKVCTVGGGFSDGLRDLIWNNFETDYLGKVFEATGKGLFSTGSLRHPAFSRMREDKNPEDCKR